VKLLLNLICILAIVTTCFAVEDDSRNWLNYSNPFPVKSVIPYGDGLFMATGGGLRFRTKTADDMYTSSKGLSYPSMSAVVKDDKGLYAVGDNGIVVTPTGANDDRWIVLSRSYVGSGIHVIPDMVRIARPVLVIAFEDRLSFFSLKTQSSIMTVDKILNASLSQTPISAMEIRKDSLYVAINGSLYVRKMNWENLEEDMRLSDPDSWSVVKEASVPKKTSTSDSTITPIKAIVWKDGKLKTYATAGTRIWDKDGETSATIDTFSVMSSSAPLLVLRGKVMKDSILYERIAVGESGKDSEKKTYYKNKIQWVSLLPSGQAIMAGPKTILYYDGKKFLDLTANDRFLIGSAYELQALPQGGVLAASEQGEFSKNINGDWTEPVHAYEIMGNFTNARGHDLKTFSVLPDGNTFYHIWGAGYFFYRDWGSAITYAAMSAESTGKYCMDRYSDNYTITVSSTPAPDGSGFLTTSASEVGYSLVYIYIDPYGGDDMYQMFCAETRGSASVGGPMYARIDKNGNWVVYVGTRHGMTLDVNGDLDVFTFPPPKSRGGELTDVKLQTFGGLMSTSLDMVYEPISGYFWFVTETSLAYWNEDETTIKSPLSTNGLTGASFTSIDADSRGNLWVGTAARGAYRLTPSPTNPDTLSVLHFTTRQGLYSNVVQDVAVDSILGFVWFTHENGISRYSRNDLRGTDGNMTNDARQGVKVFPNPFRPKHYHNFVYFDNISDDAVICVYNRGGKMVASFRGDDVVGGRVMWDGKMSNGNLVAPGVYQYVIRGGSTTKKGKLIIVH